MFTVRAITQNIGKRNWSSSIDFKSMKDTRAFKIYSKIGIVTTIFIDLFIACRNTKEKLQYSRFSKHAATEMFLTGSTTFMFTMAICFLPCAYIGLTWPISLSCLSYDFIRDVKAIRV